MTEKIEVSDLTAEFLEQMAEEIDGIDSKEEALQHCVEQQAKFYV